MNEHGEKSQLLVNAVTGNLKSPGVSLSGNATYRELANIRMEIANIPFAFDLRPG
jgi:hypothetical protein